MKKVTRFVQTLVMAAVLLFSTGAWAQTTLLTEGFDGTTIPSGWTQVNELGTTNWLFGVVGGHNGYPATTHSGAYNAQLYYGGYGVKTLLITPSLNFGTNPIGTLTFWHAQQTWGGDQDSLTVLYRTSSTGTWTKLAIYQASLTTWTQETINLPNVNGTYQIAFRGCGYYGYGVCLDDVQVTAMSAAPVLPVTVTVGTGTSSTVQYPYYTYWHDARTQFILTKAEMNAGGGVAGTITTYGLNVSSPQGQIMNGFNVRMGHTTLTTLSGFEPTTNMTTVYSTPLYVTTTGWQNILLTTPFVWNGTDNIIVEICYDNTSWSSSAPVYASTTSGNMTWMQATDNATGCAFSAGAGQTLRPNIRFTLQPFFGTLMGNVKNCYNNAVIPNPNIFVGSTPTPYVGFANGNYLLNYPIGTWNVRANATGFLDKTKTANIAEGQTTTLDFCLDPIPATITGVVTSCATGLPVVGAKITLGTAVAYSTGPNGAFTLNVYPATTGIINATKDGFDNFVGTSGTYTPPNNYTYNICLVETTNPVNTVVATLNTAQTAVDIAWNLPIGSYQLIYDDGIAENFAIWATAGNKNAVKFTPLMYPVTLNKAKINIGTADNYPSGANPLNKTVQIAVYDNSGPGGMPGAELVAPFDYTVGTYGWNDITLPGTVIASGSFYIAVIQGGTPPNTPGLAVDTTTQQLRSYSKFGSGPWIPASGNFLIRAIVTGSGGPLDAASSGQEVTAVAVPNLIYAHTPATHTGIEGVAQVLPEGDSPESITGYQVWRLKQGEELTPGVWTTIGTPSTTSMTDPAWPSLPCGAYLWAVKAQYTGNRWSTAAFSNVLGKCWTANVTVNVDLSCDSIAPSNALVKLVNVTYPDTVYQMMTDANGQVVFPAVWKGTYNLSISKFDFITYTQNNIVIMGDITLGPVVLLQVKAPPTGMTVDDRTLWSSWVAPQYQVPIFTETFASGSFTTNQWVIAGGSNWMMSTSVGQPAPSAQFYYSPQVTNYSQTLTSKTLAGVASPVMKVQYDLYLDNYGNTTLEQMAVELWDGTTWHSIANHDNSSGADIPWTTFQADATPYSGLASFKIRFRAYGEDSNNIDNWYIDNIKVLAMQPEGVDPCMLAYNVYLNNIQIATLPPTQTTYRIPPSVVHYGTTYNACVLAVYGSGYSTTSCDMFTSHFLYPPKNIAAQAIEDAAYITWDKPVVSDDAMSYNSFGSTPVAGSFADAASAPSTFVSSVNIPVDNTDATYGNGNIVNSPGTGAGGADESIIEAPGNNFGFGAQIVAASNSCADDFVVPAGGWNVSKFTFYTYQTGASTAGTITGCMFRIWNGVPNAGGSVIWGDMTTNKMSSQTFSNVYRVQNAAGGVDRAIIKVECNVTGLNLPAGTYWVEFGLTGSLSSGPWIPPVVGTPPNTPNAMQNQAGTWVTINDNGVPRELPFQIEHDGSGGGGGTPDGLIGYNVYRDDAFRHFVPDPDTLFYYDMHLMPGTYCYDVTAKYDLTAYGFAGQFDESLVASNGPACVDIIYGVRLPFYEPWDMGTFTFNDWTTVGGNWSINTGLGNPAPSADFSWQPIVTDYEQAIVTPMLSAAAWTCADLWIDFDLKLVNRNSTGDEKLAVEIFNGTDWVTKMEFENSNDIAWTPQHIDIKNLQGKAFKVRFRAYGAHSDDIMHWYVDNVHVYGICKAPGFAPTNVTQSQFTTTLTWTAPVCAVPTQIIKLFQWDGTPDNGYYQNYDYAYGVVYDLTTYPDAVLKKIDYHHASWGTIGTWQYMIHVVDWDSYTEAATIGPLTTTGNDIWETDILLGDVQGLGGHNVGIMLEPMSNSATDAYPCFSADNIGPDGVSVFGALPDYSSFGTSGIGDFLQNLWVEVPLEDGAVTFVPNKVNVNTLPNNAQTRVAGPAANTNGFLMTNQNAYVAQNNADSSHLLGYNIFRTDGTGTGPFTQINTSIVNALTYADVHPSTTEPGQTYLYYIQAVFEDSQDAGFIICTPNSDTVSVDWPAVGINDLTNSGIQVFPNPASTYVTVEATSAIKSVEVLNFIGQTIYTAKNVNKTSMKLNVQEYESGVYFVKVTSVNGTRTTKVTVTH